MILLSILIISKLNLIKSCDIEFPNPTSGTSNKFDIDTTGIDAKTQKFQSLRNYETNKLYKLILSIDYRLKWNSWRISSVYIKLNNLNNDDILEKTGQLIYNNSQVPVKLKNCNNVLEIDFSFNNNINRLPETVDFYWKSPADSVNGCIKFTVVLIFVRQYKRLVEGKTHMLCPPPSIDNNNDVNDGTNNVNGMFSDLSNTNRCNVKLYPPQINKCNIQSTAIYNMVIENKWNHLNHWKDWPGREGFTPQLTEFLGASHSPRFNLYHFGGQASQAVKDACSKGRYSELQKQLFNSGTDILSLIIARPILVSGITYKRNALVAVNNTHHLISFLSRIDPSPDWCIGLSRFDLCKSASGTCNWPTTVQIDLFPWDAGVVEGNSYVGGKQNDPDGSPVCPITDTWPNDNPFTVIGGKMQSVGKITLNLIQEINKEANVKCIPRKPTILRDEEYSDKTSTSKYLNKIGPVSQKNFQRHCKVKEWSKWSSCSSSCGKGKQSRTRKFVRTNKTTMKRCNKIILNETRKCHQPCPPELIAKVCQLRLWNDWSPCNATCIKSGVSYREREFLTNEERAECQKFAIIKEIRVCRQSTRRCKPSIICRSELNYGDRCKWEPQSNKYYFDIKEKKCIKFLYHGCYGNLNKFNSESECQQFCATFVNQKLSRNNNIISNSYVNTKNIGCSVPVSWGISCPSKPASYRWYFDMVHRKCYRFHFAGCQGNGNNFRTRSLCEEQCLHQKLTVQPTDWNTEAPQSTINKQIHRQCVYGPWTDWTKCDCYKTDKKDNTGKQTRYRVPMKNVDLCAINDVSGGALSNQMRVCQCVNKDEPKAAKMIDLKPDSNTQSSQSDPNQPCKYTNWSLWSPCSAECGRGVRERSRQRITENPNCQPQFPQFNDREFCYNYCWNSSKKK